MLISKVGRGGQITLPVAIRRRLRLQQGDRVVFVPLGDNVLLQPLNRTLLDLRSSIPVSGPQDFDAIRRRVAADHARKVVDGEA